MNKFALGCGVVLAILLFIVVVAALAIGGSYNRLVRLQQAVDQSWAQVQNVYQRRADLIPNLVNTVAGAANFEKSTLVEIQRARIGRAGEGRSEQGADRSRGACEVRTSATWIVVGALAIARGDRALSRPQSE